MDGWALLGLLLILYAAAVVWIAVKKPTSIWKMPKIALFVKVLGERGTQIFFYIFAAVAFGVGIWLMALR